MVTPREEVNRNTKVSAIILTTRFPIADQDKDSLTVVTFCDRGEHSRTSTRRSCKVSRFGGESFFFAILGLSTSSL
jgi:hypothetical protein